MMGGAGRDHLGNMGDHPQMGDPQMGGGMMMGGAAGRDHLGMGGDPYGQHHGGDPTMLGAPHGDPTMLGAPHGDPTIYLPLEYCGLYWEVVIT